MTNKRALILAPAALVAALLLGACSSSTQADRAAMPAESSASQGCFGSELPVIDLASATDPVTMTVCQLGQFTAAQGDADVEITSSNTDVVDTFAGYQEQKRDGSMFELAGKGIVATSVGTADVTITSGDTHLQFRVLVTQ